MYELYNFVCKDGLNFLTSHVYFLFQFYMLNITYPNYLFITHGWYQRNWWNSTLAKLTIPCSDEEMRKALQGNIALQQFPKPYDPNAQTDAGIVSS